MSKNFNEPPYNPVPPQGAPPSYAQTTGYGDHPGPAGGYPQPGFNAPPPTAVYPQGFVPAVGTPQPAVQTVVTVLPLGPEPAHMVCPHCHSEITTSVKTEAGSKAIMSGTIIALFGCWLGCCLIPCCMDDCMDTQHNCPKCGAYLGKYKA